MTERFVTRGFVGSPRRAGPGVGRRRVTDPSRAVPHDRLSGAVRRPDTPDAIGRWSLSIEGLVREPVRWTWDLFLALPAREWTVDISCVTKWTKLDTRWRGVSVDTLLEARRAGSRRHLRDRVVRRWLHDEPAALDVLNSQAFVAFEYEGRPLAAEHGGPARLVVPGRYLWKSAKWVRGLRLQSQDEPGFWESLGYHNRGDQWLEQRYSGD